MALLLMVFIQYQLPKVVPDESVARNQRQHVPKFSYDQFSGDRLVPFILLEDND